MSKEPVTFNDYVVRNIIANNQFGITEVNNLESLKSIFFVREEYSGIEELIRSGDIKAIKLLDGKQPRTEEYLDVMMFKDQLEKEYIVTVYDSSALEQDPQVIEIYIL